MGGTGGGVGTVEVGLEEEAFPSTGGIPSRASARRTPAARSGVRTSATRAGAGAMLRVDTDCEPIPCFSFNGTRMGTDSTDFTDFHPCVLSPNHPPDQLEAQISSARSALRSLSLTSNIRSKSWGALSARKRRKWASSRVWAWLPGRPPGSGEE